MKPVIALIAVFLLCLSFAAGTAVAQDKSLPQMKSDFLADPLDGLNPNASIPDNTIETFYDNCRSIYPERFTPEGLTYYCKCTAASMQGVMRVKDYKEITQPKNQTINNKAYVRYLTKVVVPCLDAPVEDMEYYSCVLNRTGDRRILSIPDYCKCVSATVSQFVQKFGDAEAVIALGGSRYRREPLKALWNSEGYKGASRNARNQCIPLHVKTVQQLKLKQGCE